MDDRHQRCDVLVVAADSDVTDRKRLEEELQRLAERDLLTGLFNRRRFGQELRDQLEYGKRYGSAGAVMVLDLDHFKEINDTLSHEAGDRMLVAVAGALSDRLRGTDTVARLGGDEFAALSPEVTAREANGVAKAVVHAVREGAVPPLSCDGAAR
jgi:diguanylate cyclase (GGDEF)-like protein